MLAKQPPEIVDREFEVRTLVSASLDTSKNINYALIGFRRIGKTTILQEVKGLLIGKGIIVVYLDFSSRRYDPVGFFRDMVNGITQAYYELSGPRGRILDNVRMGVKKLGQVRRARIRLELSLDPSTGSPTITPIPYLEEKTPDYSALFRASFDYANEIARRSGHRAVVMIDEFQYMTEWRKRSGLEAISELFKGVVESRGNVVYIISGSRAHFLKNFLGSGSSPLFGLFNIIDVSYLSRGASKELYRVNDPSASEEDAERAYLLVGGHPFYLIALATSRRSQESLNDTYQRILTSQTGPLSLYVKYVLTEDIGTDAKGPIMPQIMRALSEHPMTVSQIARASRVRMSSLPKFLRRLIELDLIRKKRDKYEIIDRVIADYLRLNP